MANVLQSLIMKNSELVKSSTKLTIGMLVSNRIEYMEKALTALKPLLDNVPSELILVDTVGEEASDGSLAVCRKFTDKIYHFDWCNDFAKARNVAFEHAAGEWFMFQDDDEIFEDVSEIVDFFRSGECEKYMTGMYHIVHYLGDGTSETGIVQRMIRRKTDSCFVGRIHEHFNEACLPCKTFDAFVHHYGYMLTTKEAVRAHQKRNITLLREEIAECGLNARLGAQLIREQIFTDGTEDEGYETLLEVLDGLPKEELFTPHGQWIPVAAVRYFKKKAMYKEALEKAAEIREKYVLSETARLTLSWNEAVCAAQLNDLTLTLEKVREYEELFRVLTQNGTLRLTQMSFDTEAYFRKNEQSQMYVLGLVCEYNAGDHVKAVEYAKKAWEAEGDLNGTLYGDIVGKALLHPGNEKEYERFLHLIYSEEGIRLINRGKEG